MKRCLILLAVSGLALTTGLSAQPAVQPPSSAEAHADAKYEGEVRNFKPGESLEVEIGAQKSKSYDLTDKNASYTLDPNMAKGDRVNIIESKDAAGKLVVEVRVKPK